MTLLSLKIHRSQRETVVAVCDSEILGMKFHDDGRRIEVYSSFYGGSLIREEELEGYLKASTIMNLVGRRTVGLAITLGYVDPDRVLTIGETVHAQGATMQK